jgi:hypothetical protein
MSTLGEDKGTKCLEDWPPMERTWEVGKSYQCNRSCRLIPLGPPVFPSPILLDVQAPIDPALPPKKRRIRKIWKGGSRFYVDVKGPMPKARQK